MARYSSWWSVLELALRTADDNGLCPKRARLADALSKVAPDR